MPSYDGEKNTFHSDIYKQISREKYQIELNI